MEPKKHPSPRDISELSESERDAAALSGCVVMSLVALAALGLCLFVGISFGAAWGFLAFGGACAAYAAWMALSVRRDLRKRMGEKGAE